MHDIANSKLDLIWTLAADEFVKDLIRESKVPRADAVMDPFTEHQILKMIRKEHGRAKRRKVWKVVRIALVACLVVATLALAACMALPTIREAIWKVVLDWSNESVKIGFALSNDPDYTNPAVTTTDTTSEPSEEPKQPIAEPPASIKEVNIPSYVPAGYTVQSSISQKVYMLSYFDADGNETITFRQMTISSDSKGDAQEGTATDVNINGLKAVLITYEDQPNAYVLYWQDSQYRYNINGYFNDYDELLKTAASVAVK